MSGLMIKDPFLCILQNMWEFLNSNFSTAFFGAIAGSLTILAVEWYRGHRRTLADINASIGILTGLLNTFLNIKRQHSLPVSKMYQEDCEKRQAIMDLQQRGISPSQPIEIVFNLYLKMFHCPQLHFDVPIERIFALTDKNPGMVHILLQAKRSINEVQIACATWNDLTKQMVALPEEKRIEFYFGARASNGIRNTFYGDTVQNLSVAVDDALFFTKRAIQEVTKTGKAHLLFGFKKKIAKIEIVDDEHKALMPPENYKSGW